MFRLNRNLLVQTVVGYIGTEAAVTKSRNRIPGSPLTAN